MEMHERIKELRKKHLNLSQEAFGKKLGVSRSVINNIERNCLARPEQKLSLIKLMCKEFSVNEEWLLNGAEPMFIEPDTFSLDDFVKSKGATELELEIVKTYFELDPAIRSAAIEHFKKHLLNTNTEEDIKEEAKEKKNSSYQDLIPDTIEEFEQKFPKKENKNKDAGSAVS